MIKIYNTEYDVEVYNLTIDEINELVNPIIYRWQWEFASMGSKKVIEAQMQRAFTEYVVNRRNSKLELLCD